jgi:hypothetical protein
MHLAQTMQSVFLVLRLSSGERERMESPTPFRKGPLMRTAWIFVLGLGLTASALGCYTCQHTAGVCDCDPPPVYSVLQPPPRPTYGSGIGAYPAIPRVAPPVVASPAPMPTNAPPAEAVPVMPHAADPK